MLAYLLIRLLTFPFAYMPYSWLHAIGRALGPAAYHLLPKWRKRALSNIAIVYPDRDPRPLAKASFQSLLITCLEYPRLSREKDITRIVYCDNPGPALELLKQGKGIIFFCGHQANWELLFLEGTSRMPGVAIGRPLKNRWLYAWVKRMRERFGGTIITPKEAVKEGLRALKRGKFLGIVGDQGMPDSGFKCPFLGRLAWTSPLPGLLASRAEAPLIVASVIREKARYRIHYSNPIAQGTPEEMMRMALAIFEESVRDHPDQWLWIHNRWKQQTLETLKKPYREDAIALFLPAELVSEAEAFRTLYPTEFLAIFVPRHANCAIDAEIHFYDTVDDVLLPDYRFKLLYNFIGNKRIDRHYMALSASQSVHLNDLKPGDTLLTRLNETIHA